MNERIVRMLLAAGTAVGLLSLPAVSHAAEIDLQPTVIISEVAWAGSSLSTVDEWLELTNLTDQPVDIGGWTLVGAASSGGTVTIPGGSVIAPYSTFLISNYDESNDKCALAITPSLVTTSISLSNSALSLVLADAAGIVHDAAWDGTAPVAGSTGGDTGGYAAMARRSPVTDGTLVGAWESATASSGFDAGVADLGTPGTLEAWFVPTQTSGTPEETAEPEPVVSDEAEPDATGEPIAIETMTEEPVAETTPTVEVPVTEEAVEITAVPISETPVETDTATEEGEPVDANAVPVRVLQINEFVSDATDEWIEIANVSGADIALFGWSVTDATGKSTALPDQTLGAGQFLVIMDPKGILNNDGDTITLLDPSGALVDEIVYGTDEIPAPEKGESTACDADGSWSRTTTPTPGAANAFTIEVAATEEEAPAAEMETVTTEAETVETDTVETFSAGALRISEFASDAEDEWIEIQNPGGADISLFGWTVEDATGKTTALPEETLGAGQFILVMSPKGQLNNDGDMIVLRDPSGAAIDEITYGTEDVPSPGKGESAARKDDGTWATTDTPTPGSANIFTVTDDTDESSTPSQTNDEEAESDSSGSDSSYVADNDEIAWTGPVTLRLSELYANASGDDATEEFIEVENTGDAALDLQGWSLADASGKVHVFDASIVIAPHAFVALGRDLTKLTLNNDADTVTLTAPNGTVVDTRSYDHAKEGSSFILLSPEWVWSGTPTPNEPNYVPADAASSAGTAASGSGGSISAGTVRTSVEGTVLVPPGVLSSQTFYVQTEDGGTQVYKYDGDFPDLAEGDVVRVTGTQTTARGEERVKVSKTDSIRVVSSGEPVEPEQKAIADLSESDSGRLVQVVGTVVTRSGDRVTVEDGPDQLSVRVAQATGIDASVFARGKKVRVTGILVAASGTLTLLPRSPDDIEVLADELPVAGLAAEPTGNQSAASRDATTAALITAGVALTLAAYSARKFGPKFLLWYAKARALRAAA